MLRYLQILISAIVLGMGVASLTACGQQGPLYLPTEPAAAKRATLPETLLPLNRTKATPAGGQTPPAPAIPTAPASTPSPQ
ncbi:MAG: lipoprotein [Pseudomonadota bacterium]